MNRQSLSPSLTWAMFGRQIFMRSLPKEVAGVGFGLVAVLCWASYNLSAKIAIDAGFQANDLAFLRYSVAGLLFAPLALGRYRYLWRSMGLGPILFLSLLAGPMFGTIAMAGYAYAPLSHGVLFAPATVMIVGVGLSIVWGKESFSRSQRSGAILILLGLLIVSGFEIDSAGSATLIGDGLFIMAGVMWGTFTFLAGRYQVPAMGITAVVMTTSAVLSLPFYALTSSGTTSALNPVDWLTQAFMQGVVGGVLATFAAFKAIEYLGSARASTLPALTPIVALLLAVPVMGTLPTTTETLGTFSATVGLLIALRR